MVYHDLTRLENRLSGEINIESIRALEEQIRGHEMVIREHEMAIIKLKSAQNSLLNISTLPPEVLGNIFRWNVILEEDFGRLEKRSHNFLLVCRHWFEVASRTPEPWSFWGNNLRDWAKRHHRHPTSPLDLVLDGMWYPGDTLIGTLRNALQDRAARDTIRRIHLIAGDSELLSSIILPLTADCEGIRSNSVESLILRDDSTFTSIDISDFFAHYRFPKLRRLELFNCTISSWGLIMSRTPALTTLALGFSDPSTITTTSQVLSTLASIPTLQKVLLCGCGFLDDGGGESSFRVSLHHLRELELVGDSARHVIGLLQQMDHPSNMDNLTVSLEDCKVADISQIIGPLLRDYLRCRGRSQSGLGLFLSSEDHIVLHVGDAGGIDLSSPAQMNPFVVITIELNRVPFKDLLEKVSLDLIAHIPPEDVVYFHGYRKPVDMKDLSAQLPNLRTLHFDRTPLPAAFPNPGLDRDGEIFPSLRHLFLDWVVVDCGDWSSLTTFLDCRASSGNQLHSLVIIGSYHMRPALPWIFRKVVGEFILNNEKYPRYLSS